VIVFGIHPGSHRTGWGVVRLKGSALVCLGAGVIAAPADAPLAERVEPIFLVLGSLLRSHAPDHVYLESLFHHHNAKSALILGHARGVALLAARLAGCRVDEVSPAEVKKSVTGNGRADKEQVQEMVRVLLGLKDRAASDASDALAIAIAGSSRATSPILQRQRLAP
jgi:crossover junction endodeoxyribonuclease RuvC